MNINLSKWMEKVNNDKNLLSLDIPGAHDCAANFIEFSAFSRCQNKDIFGLLAQGIRVLDVRVDIKGNSLVLVHSVSKAFVSNEKGARQLEISDVIKSIKRFLKENPTEAVIMQFKNDSEKKQEQCFDILYNRFISKEKELWYLENRVPSMGEVRGKILLLRRCKMYMTNKPYNAENSGIDFSEWIDQDIRIPDALTLETHSKSAEKFIIQDRYKYAPKSRWKKCIKPFLDERGAFVDGQYVICYTSTAGGLKMPVVNAAYINKEFLDYSLEKNKYYGIIYFDFPTKQMTKKVIENNFE